jgi:hypothetical protein
MQGCIAGLAAERARPDWGGLLLPHVPYQVQGMGKPAAAASSTCSRPAAARPPARPPAALQVPEPYPHEASAEFFRNPDVLAAEEIELKWTAPNVDGLVAFLCGEKQFNEDRWGAGGAFGGGRGGGGKGTRPRCWLASPACSCAAP